MFKDALLKKIEAHDRNREKNLTKEGFVELLTEVDKVLIEVEKELESHKGNCCCFSIYKVFIVYYRSLLLLFSYCHWYYCLLLVIWCYFFLSLLR